MVGFVRDVALNDRGCFASLAMTEVAAVTARPKAAAVLELFLQIASPVCFVAMLLAMTIDCFASLAMTIDCFAALAMTGIASLRSQ